MLWNASAINGHAIIAKDGRLGTVSDFLFDDVSWRIRWLVVDTGAWLPGRKVLLAPAAMGHVDPKEQTFSVELTMQQVKNSPGIDTDRPVSRQIETDIYDYYGWSPYWGNGLFTDGYGYVGQAQAVSQGSMLREATFSIIRSNEDDPHLRSIEAVTGYHIHAKDGEIGHVDDFLLEEEDWSIRYLIVDTNNWWFGKKVLISPQSAREIDWANRLVDLDIDRQRIKDSPTYDASLTFHQADDETFLTYYGIKWIKHDRPL